MHLLSVHTQTHLAPGSLFSLHLFQFVNLMLQAESEQGRDTSHEISAIEKKRKKNVCIA